MQSSKRYWSKAVAAATILALAATLEVVTTAPALAQTSTLYDFDTPGQLDNLFHGVGAGVGSVEQKTDDGIGDTGAIHVPASIVDAVFTSKDGYSLGPVGSVYTFSTYLKSTGNNGYSGVGFTISSPATADRVTAFRPDDAFGISVHGGGFVFHNGNTNYSGSWNSSSFVGEAIHVASGCSDLINNTTSCGSPDSWWQIRLIVERVEESKFDLTVEVWAANVVDGSLRFSTPSAAFAVRGVENSAILDAPQLFSYFSFSGHRVTRFDEYQVELDGGATVVAPGNPVVLTEAVEIVGNPTISLAGRVAADGGTAVVERGFVYSTSPRPTLTDTKVPLGSGTGTFTGETALPASGTYYFRSFATNSTGTSFGAETSVDYVSSAPDPTPDADPAPAPAATPAWPMEQAAGLTGTAGLLIRDSTVVPLLSTIAPTVGPRGGLVLEDEDGAVKVTITTTAGVSPTAGIVVPVDGEIVCEVCMSLAADTVVEGWILSEPRLAGAVLVEDSEDGTCPLLRIPFGAPLDGAGAIESGVHTLQLRMYTDNGFEVLAVPITVGDVVPTSVPAGEGPGGPVSVLLLAGLAGFAAASAGLRLRATGQTAATV